MDDDRRTVSRTPRLVVVVPCFNEAGRLDTAAFLAGLDAHPSLEFVFVDDGSSDGTLRVLEALAATRHGRVHCLRLAENSGKAEAVRQGVQRALSLGPSIVGFLDADLATPIRELVGMASELENPDVVAVLASRVALLGRDIRRSAWRHYTGRVFATAASAVLGLRVYDTQCGAKLFRNCPPVTRAFDRAFLSSWAFDVEILARLRQEERSGAIAPLPRAVVEVPLRQWIDVAGSKIGLMSALVAAAQLLLIWWRYRA
jgi:glycosyltransferase involved in cell wall biosynthesis